MNHWEYLPGPAIRINTEYYLAKEDILGYQCLFHTCCNSLVLSGSILKVIEAQCNNDVSTDELWDNMINNLYNYDRGSRYKCKCDKVAPTIVLDIAERIGCLFR